MAWPVPPQPITSLLGGYIYHGWTRVGPLSHELIYQNRLDEQGEYDITYRNLEVSKVPKNYKILLSCSWAIFFSFDFFVRKLEPSDARQTFQLLISEFWASTVTICPIKSPTVSNSSISETPFLIPRKMGSIGVLPVMPYLEQELVKRYKLFCIWDYRCGSLINRGCVINDHTITFLSPLVKLHSYVSLLNFSLREELLPDRFLLSYHRGWIWGRMSN